MASQQNDRQSNDTKLAPQENSGQDTRPANGHQEQQNHSDLPVAQQQMPAQQQRQVQQPEPAQLQLGPPGPYQNQGLPIPSQQQTMVSPGPYQNQGPPIPSQQQPMASPGYIQRVPGPYPPQGPLIVGQPMLQPGYMQGYLQAVQTQPQIQSPGYNQGYPQPIQTQPGPDDFTAGFIGQMMGLGRVGGGRRQPSPGSFDREGPSVGVELTPLDDEACLSVSAEYGEVSKDICGGFTTLICAGPTAGCDMGCGCDTGELSVENGCTLSLCGASCIFGCCLLTLGLALDSKVTWSAGGAEFELLGTGIDTEEGCALNVFGSKIGFIDEEKKRKYEEKRQRRKARKEEMRKENEQTMNQQPESDPAGVINNGATVEDAM